MMTKKNKWLEDIKECVCGQEFYWEDRSGKYNNKKFCSNACKQKAYRGRGKTKTTKKLDVGIGPLVASIIGNANWDKYPKELPTTRGSMAAAIIRVANNRNKNTFRRKAYRERKKKCQDTTINTK